MDASMRPCVMRPASWVDLRVDRLIHSEALVLSSQKYSGSCFGEAQVRNTWAVVFFLSSVFFMGEKTIINLKTEDWGRKKGKMLILMLIFCSIWFAWGEISFWSYPWCVFCRVFWCQVSLKNNEKHDLGGKTKGGTILQFAESKQKKQSQGQTPQD